MKTSIVIAAVATLFAAFGASAQEVTNEPAQVITSNTTRAAVYAELLQARANGTAEVGGEVGRQPLAVFVAQRSRADVDAEARAAAADHGIAQGELFGMQLVPGGSQSASSLYAAK
jgi:hypothetical protein